MIKIKITLNFEDIKKLIEDSYDGIINISNPLKDKDIEIVLEVDGDIFKRKNNFLKQIKDTQVLCPKSEINKLTKKVEKINVGKIDIHNPVNYDELIKGKPLVDSGVHKPEQKTLDEKNKSALKKGLMTTGRNTERTLMQF